MGVLLQQGEESTWTPEGLMMTPPVSVSVCVCVQVLFPLLTKLLDNISPADVGGMEETRMRACTLLSKVSSHHQPVASPR